MKRLYLFFGIISVSILLLFGVSVQMNSQKQATHTILSLYNWGDYIDPDLLKKFTHETGIPIQYETFDSNEAMYAKIKQGNAAYDIAFPSEYMVAKMKQERLLHKLDHRQIKGLKNIGSDFLNHSFDPNNQYSIPYFWGTLGIVYNQKLLKHPPKHWIDLWKPKYRRSILMIDSAREVLGIGLNALGYSLNSTNPKQIQQATEKLYQLTPNLKALISDEMKDYLVQEEAPIGVSFSGEAMQMLEKNKNLRYIVPTEASNLWFDNMVIPKTAHHLPAAYRFINFMLRTDNAKQNAEYIGYATPHLKAKERLDKRVREDKTFYPDQQTMKHLEVYQSFNPYYTNLYNDLYLQIKLHHK